MLPCLISVAACPLHRILFPSSCEGEYFLPIKRWLLLLLIQGFKYTSIFPTVLPALYSHHVTENQAHTLSGTLSQCGDPLSVTCHIFHAQPTAVKLFFFLKKKPKSNEHSSV